MTLAIWEDEGFRRWASALLVVQGMLLVVLGLVSAAGTPAIEASAPAGAIPAQPASEPAPAAAQPAAREAAAAAEPSSEPNRVINDRIGRVGPIRLGMTIGQVRGQLGEPLVPIQEAATESQPFQYLAPEAGIRIEGTGRRVDTITVTNTGDGPAFQTTRGIRVGSPEHAIGRQYVYAYLVCGTEFWVDRGDMTLRMATAASRVSSITVSRRKRAPYVECP